MHLLNLSVFYLVATFARSASSQIDLIESSNIKIKARLQVVPNDDEFLIREIELFETYSNANERSLIEIKSPYNNGRTLNFYATKDGLKIEYDPMTATCLLVESKLYLEALFGSLATQKIEPINQWTDPIDGIPGHLMGLGRLLALIQAEKIKPKETTAKQYIRGKPSFGYSFILHWASSLLLEVDAFYTDNLSDSEGLQHPVRVLAKYKGRSIFMVDIYSIESNWVKPHGNLDHLDPTTLPLGLGCASVQKSRMASDKFLSKAIFTMDAEFTNQDLLPTPRKQFIAYDANQQALRRDTILETPLESVYLKSIYDLKNGRQYSMKFESGKDELVEKQGARRPILQIDELPMRECVASELEQGDYKALIPFEQLAYCGTGLVRGREVDIYEMSSATLPELFFPLSRFVNMEEQWQMYDANETQSDQQYQLVYHFTGDNGAIVETPITRALVRVDVFRKRQLIKQVNVYNFIWQLVEAPNGDPVESLFSLHHTCSSVLATGSRQLTYAPDRSIHMSMELEFLLTTPQNGNTSDMLEALQSAPVRNAAILRGLVANSKSLSPVQLVGLRSFLKTSITNQTSHHTLLISARIILVEDDFFRPRMFSYGWIYPKFQPIQGLRSFEECFNEASRRRKSDHILFTFTDFGCCYIDDRPIFEIKSDEDSKEGSKAVFTYSNIFGLERKKSAVKVMQVDLVENVKSKQSKQLAWSQIKSDLMKQSITLPSVQPETMGATTTSGFFFRVAKMEMDDKLEGQKSSDSISLDGLGLLSGHDLTKAEETMDTDTCRSACLKDMECRSYSICISGRQLECVVSEVDFRDTKIVSKLEEQRGQVSKLKSSQKTFSLDVGVHENGANQSVGLKIDRRCRLFKKLPVEMFTEWAKTRTSLNQKVIAQVESVQECAEKCLQMNLKYLRSMSSLGRDSSIKRELNFKRNLKNWCAIFKFFDLDSTLYSKNLVEHGVLGGITKNGLCLLPRRLVHDGEDARESDDQVIDSKLTLEMDTFTFSYINLYEPRDDVRMVPSDGLSGENKRMMIQVKSIEECARACFMQTSGLIPFCRSFELVQPQESESMKANPGGDGSRGMTLCALNSMSLADAKQAGIYEKVVTTRSDPRVVAKHYEPHQGYLMNENILGSLLTPEPNLAATTKNKSTLDFSLTILIIFAAVSGFVAGTKLKQPLVRLWLERNDHQIRMRRLSQNSVDL